MSDAQPIVEAVRALGEAALPLIAAAPSPEALRALQAAHVGPGSPLAACLASIPGLPAAQRGAVGRQANAEKARIQAAVAERAAALERARDADLAEREWVDPTLPGSARMPGTLHPVMRMARELEDVFMGLGFTPLDGPWVEDDRHNFGALNIPPDHPARDMQDTFWLQDGHLLRTQTSPVQIRAMESRPPPLRVVSIGRVFRREEVDATHENTFHQVEGLMVDRDVSVSHLVWVLRTALSAVFRSEIEVRLRPAYFPFVEPGFEMEMRFRGRWMEILGCGMVHARVLAAAGVDAETWSGFAFGLGVDRLAMLRHGVEDIRHFMAGDLRFLAPLTRGVEA